MPLIKSILVPTDFSPASDIAFQYAIDRAVTEGSTIHLLHALDETSFATAYPDGFYVELPGLREQLIADADRRLQSLVTACAAAGVPSTSQTVVGRPARLIAEVAKARGTDLIVMGTHGRSGFAHMVLGSVAERVVRTAPCAVLTVRDSSRTADAVAEAAARAQGAQPAAVV
jgi:nucleotide-binding universal stress UspA family protein